MIDQFKVELAQKIEQKSVAVAILFDSQGRILWHAGRKISGKTLESGRGFSKSLVEKALRDGGVLRSDEEVITLSNAAFPQSASLFYVKSLFILPIEPGFLLYVDSGNDCFSEEDITFFHHHAATLQKIVADIKHCQSETGGIAGQSVIMESIRNQVIRYAVEADPILLMGETGTGKSHIAQLIHHFSGRPGQFIIFDSPAVPETIFESELFGHSKGAFTSADRDRCGLVESANQGTLFFDEISEVPLPVQAKLLRFIETQRYRPLGENRERFADVRIIAASNRQLDEEIIQKRFRQDLFYRLNVLPITIPPLRQRPEDIQALVLEYRHFLRGIELKPSFWQSMHSYNWPGNVRELLNVLKRIGIQHDQPELGHEVSQYFAQASPNAPSNGLNATALVTSLQDQINSGESFWDTAWQAFLDRHLNRDQLRAFLTRFTTDKMSLKDFSKILHIKDHEYARFISVLHKYDIHPSPLLNKMNKASSAARE